ncbi:hypothetical protein G7046_g1544 [Stylonectria norvegica]|nr:hypothetical protein G7046_g1544 [Stylonectria norvegica]
MSDADLVVGTSPADGVWVIVLNRPKKRNALSRELIDEHGLHDWPSTSEPPANESGTAGADLKEIAAMDATSARACRYLEDLCQGLALVRKPILAAVDGPALGGGFELALMCDMIFASPGARFVLPEVNLGLIPGAGGTQRLTSALGKFRAMKAILLGTPISADEALSCGLVCDLFDNGQVLEQTINVATRLASQGSIATQLAKEAICRADDVCRDDQFERNLYYFAFGTSEKAHKVEAFLKR